MPLASCQRARSGSDNVTGGVSSDVVRLNSASVTRLLSPILREFCLHNEAAGRRTDVVERIARDERQRLSRCWIEDRHILGIDDSGAPHGVMLGPAGRRDRDTVARSDSWRYAGDGCMPRTLTDGSAQTSGVCFRSAGDCDETRACVDLICCASCSRFATAEH